MVGTPNFLAPEIATRKTHSFEADVWSLGALIYQCLVGKPPFDDQGSLIEMTKRFVSVRLLSRCSDDIETCGQCSLCAPGRSEQWSKRSDQSNSAEGREKASDLGTDSYASFLSQTSSQWSKQRLTKQLLGTLCESLFAERRFSLCSTVLAKWQWLFWYIAIATTDHQWINVNSSFVSRIDPKFCSNYLEFLEELQPWTLFHRWWRVKLRKCKRHLSVSHCTLKIFQQCFINIGVEL